MSLGNTLSPLHRHVADAAPDRAVRPAAMPDVHDWSAFNAEERTTTLLLLDDAVLTRESLSLSLAGCDRRVRVVSATTHYAETLARSSFQPDVVLLNLSGLSANAPRAEALIRRLVPLLGGAPLVVLSSEEDMDAVLDALRLGVRGYIVTSAGLGIALEAIRLVAAGGTFIPSASLGSLLQIRHSAPDEESTRDAPATGEAERGGLSGLTPREMSVLNCLREGKANKLIAYELGMCESTVKMHVRNILKKLGANNRTEAVYIAYRLHTG